MSWFYAFLAVWLTSAVLTARTIDLVADAYMPYTGDSAKGETGLMIDVAKAIWKKKGHTVRYESKGWKEALTAAQQGMFTAVVGASRDDAPEFIFPKVEQARAQGAFYGLASSDWKYGGPGSLAKIKLAIISDYKYNPEIAAHIRDNRTNRDRIRSIESAPDILQRFVQLLEKEQVDAFVEDRFVVQYFLKTLDRADRFMELGQLKASTPLYIAISPRDLDAAALTLELEEGMAELRSSGELAKILEKYGVTDWQAASSAQR
jgi:polar amino acid transport system substrate-binding protein